MAEGKKIIRASSSVRHVIIRLVLSLMRRERNCSLLAGFCICLLIQKDIGLGDSLLFRGSARTAYKPWPQMSFHSVLPRLPSTPASLSFHEYKKFHWLRCDPTQS